MVWGDRWSSPSAHDMREEPRCASSTTNEALNSKCPAYDTSTPPPSPLSSRSSKQQKQVGSNAGKGNCSGANARARRLCAAICDGGKKALVAN